MVQLARRMRNRLLTSGAVGLGSGLLTWLLLHHLQLGAADFNWSLRAAQDLLAGRDVYAHPFRNDAVPYPLPAAFLALPLVELPRDVAGAIFFGASSTLLAFGLIRHSYTRLLVFLAFPYWSAMLTAQWTPLLMAATLFPVLLPATLMKPNTGVALALTSLSRRGLWLSAVVLMASLAIMPSWPLRWISQIGAYQGYLPLLLFPGQLLALALLRHRDPDTPLLLLMALSPQRWFYDAFVLWLIPKTRREILFAAAASWCAGIWRWYHLPLSETEVGIWSVLCLYLPILLVILARGCKPKGGAPSQPDHRPALPD
jgi:hypothetical protein